MKTTDHPMGIHTYFGLTYSSWLVMPRVLLEQMPEDWQHRFVAMLDEFQAAWEHVEQPEGYEVTPGAWTYTSELTDAERKLTGVTSALDHWEKPGPDATDTEVEDAEEEYERLEADDTDYDRDGNEAGLYTFVPKPCTLPHYRYPGDLKPRTP